MVAAMPASMGTGAYRNLETWQRAVDLVADCYVATERLPHSERYGLSGQIRRAAVSIPANLAEGHCRRSIRAYANHVAIALGSQAELETYFEVAMRLNLLPPAALSTVGSKCAEVGRLLSGLHRSLEQRIQEGCKTQGKGARSE
jgi:four helix bundle protein